MRPPAARAWSAHLHSASASVTALAELATGGQALRSSAEAQSPCRLLQFAVEQLQKVLDELEAKQSVRARSRRPALPR